MITAKAKADSNFKLAPIGSHTAICIAVIDLGTQDNTKFNTSQRKVMLGFELPECKEIFDAEKGEQPFIVYQEFTNSLGKKATLRKFLEGWRGQQFTDEELKGFDLEKLLGKICLIQIIHKTSEAGKERSEINAVIQPPKGSQPPAITNQLHKFSLETYSEVEYSNCPEWIQDKIKLSPEYKQAINPNVRETTGQHINNLANDDGLPF